MRAERLVSQPGGETLPAAADSTPTEWQHVPCPLCGEVRHDLIFTAENRLFGTPVVVSLRRCPCGLLLTNPQPRGATLSEFYQAAGYYTHTAPQGPRAQLRRTLHRWQLRGPLARLRLWAEEKLGKQRFAKRLAPGHFTFERGRRFLDYGCGGGQMVTLATRLGLQAIGVEPDEQARRAAQADGCRVFAGLADLDQLPAADQSGPIGPTCFDRILLKHVLEHLVDPLDTLRLLKQRLARNGRMLIAVPNADALQAQVFGEHWIGYDMPRHLWHFSIGTLRRLVELVGLREVSVQTIELAWFAAQSREQRRSATGLDTPYSPGNLRELERAGRGTEIVMVVEHAGSRQHL